MHWFRLDFLLLLDQDKSKKEPAAALCDLNLFQPLIGINYKKVQIWTEYLNNQCKFEILTQCFNYDQEFSQSIYQQVTQTFAQQIYCCVTLLCTLDGIF
jgi:hypothetical protein